MTAQFPTITGQELTLAQKANAYVKHAVGVALGVAIGEGVLDPVTNTVHISGPHSLALIGIATTVSLLASYAGLGAPAAAKVVYVAAPTSPAAIEALSAPATPGVIPAQTSGVTPGT